MLTEFIGEVAVIGRYKDTHEIPPIRSNYFHYTAGGGGTANELAMQLYV
ncbi:hypothetical protein LZY01_17260 [Levilactobacillus zymae]|uniref:Uncharacterized protein n=1 Tax=Levilactobacillus zymae TaxID=267363 RepID=A0ABQ0X520_9LACO|nr:hypothetical protein LZY01_17260 [Levilactobacillus zymae]